MKTCSETESRLGIDAASCLKQLQGDDAVNLLEVPISSIKSNGRVRGTEQQLNQLAESMKGWYMPLMLDSSNTLIAGRRRLEGLRRLGRSTAWAIVNPDFDDAIVAVKAERDENECRVELTKNERINLGTKLL